MIKKFLQKFGGTGFADSCKSPSLMDAHLSRQLSESGKILYARGVYQDLKQKLIANGVKESEFVEIECSSEMTPKNVIAVVNDAEKWRINYKIADKKDYGNGANDLPFRLVFKNADLLSKESQKCLADNLKFLSSIGCRPVITSATVQETHITDLSREIVGLVNYYPSFKDR